MKMYPLCTALFLAFFACSSPPPQEPVLPSVVVAEPIMRDTEIYLDYVGHVEAKVSVQIRSQIAGQITAKYFTEGQEVKEGNLLLTIDDRPYIAALAKAEATLRQNIASLKLSEDTAQRYSQLVQDDYIAKLDYDQYITNVLVDEAVIKENLADIETAKLNVDYCHIKAPMDSIAGELQIDVGNYVTVGESTPLVLLNQIKPIYVNFYIPERDLPQIQTYQKDHPLKTHVFVNQDTKHPFEGTLTLINNQIDENTGTLLLRATFPNEDKKLWPGEFVDVRLVLKVQKDALLIPTQALQVSRDGHYLYIVKEDQTVELRQVVVGQRQDNLTIIQSGLKAGENVVIQGQINLRPDVKVSMKKETASQTLQKGSS